MNVYFISPHLDDAILSAGGLIYDLKDKEKVKIVTVFTKGDELFLKRKVEDENVCRYLKINYSHLGFKDALWRKSYGSMEDIFTKNFDNKKEEQNLKKIITNKLKKIINNEKNIVIFSPLSVGNHADHRIINKICKDNFTNVIYWEDYPYNLKSNLPIESIKKNKLSFLELEKNLFIKEKLIKFYKSQIPVLFKNKPIIIKKEKYYYDSRLCNIPVMNLFHK